MYRNGGAHTLEKGGWRTTDKINYRGVAPLPAAARARSGTRVTS
jgi:hypothetical protein